MHVKIALPLVLLSTFALALDAGPATAQPQQPTQSKKNQKKRVEATLVEPATRPADVEAAPAAGVETDAGAAGADAATAAATPTTADAPVLEERVEVIEVLLDAIVEEGGKVVTGLGPEDFVVEEEGRIVEVTSAAFYGAPEELRASGEGDVPRSDRYFILFFHDRSRDAPALRPIMLDVGQQARRWVEEERLPNDQVAVLLYDVRLKVMSDFTRDPVELTEAISRAVTGKKEPEREAGRSKEPLRASADSPSLLLNLPGGRDLARESAVFEKALTLVGRAAQGIVGRKNLMFFSVGFGDVGPGGVWLPDTRYYPDLEQSLNDGNVAVYSIDLGGSRRTGSAGVGIASSLSSVADDTAGLYFDTFTTFMTPMKEVVKDTVGYYLLSYRSEYGRGTSGYREVKVKTREPGHKVRARRGYLYGADRTPLGKPEAAEPDDDPPPQP